jgi:hypothetical protein
VGGKAETAVLRIRSPRSAARYGVAWLMAAGVALWGAHAQAQIAANPDPLVPWLQTDPRHPPRFQRVSRPLLTQFEPPAAGLAAPAAGAGDTGFDSTNSRKKARRGTKAKPPTHAQAIAPGLPAPAPVSPYQRPVVIPAARATAQAAAPPPVEAGPVGRRPKKRKAHSEPEDPYAALGVRASGFTLFPAIELIGGYDTNPAHSSGGKGASLYTVAPELRLKSNWSRHEITGELRGNYTGYSPDSTPTLSRPNVNGKLDGRIDVTSDTRVDLGSRVLVSTDNPGSPNLQAGLARLPIFTTFGGDVGVGQRFNHLDLSLKGDFERTVYQDSQLTDGTTASNEDRQYSQYTGKARAAYEIFPGVKPFVEVDTDTRVHDLNTDSYGYQRNSRGLTGLFGSTFDLRGTLTGEVAVGYTQRTYEDARLDKLSGLIGNASLVWTANALTTVKLTATSSIGESTIPGVAGVLSRDVALQIDHAFRRWLIGTLKLGFGLDSYKGVTVDPNDLSDLCSCVVSTPGGTSADRVDKRFFAGAGLTYKLTRSVQIKGEFQQYWLRSNVTGSDYNSSVFLLGIRLQR